MSATATTLASTSRSTDVISNLANFLPTGTFLAFQSVAPLFTNNGLCGHAEKIVTSLLIAVVGAINIFIAFTDSIAVSSGKQYYGIVTSKGLYNPQFSGSSIAGVEGSLYTGNPTRYTINIFDYLHAIVSATVLGTLVLLTPPVQSCFFAHLPNTIIKSVPVLVAILAGCYFAVAPPPRNGIGYATQSGKTPIVSDGDDNLQTTTTAGVPTQETTPTNNDSRLSTDTAAASVQNPSLLAAGGGDNPQYLLTTPQRAFPSSALAHTSSESHV